MLKLKNLYKIMGFLQNNATLKILSMDTRALIGGSTLFLTIILALSATFIIPYDPYEADLSKTLLPPMFAGGTLDHPLGTDPLGRDILKQLIHGARISLSVSGLAVAISLVIGVLLGSVAGYYGGVIDDILMRIVDIWLSFPTVLLAIALMAAIGPGFWNLVIAMIVTSWAPFVRVVRGEFLSLATKPFVLAAKAAGAGDLYIIIKEMLPNVFSSLAVLVTFQLARNVVYEASLSFLGIGINPPNPSWGLMLATGRQHILNAWWLATFPGLAITIVVLGVNLLGDALGDILNPTLRIKQLEKGIYGG